MDAMIADWLTSAGLGTLKPVLSALLLPPVPFIALALVGAGVSRPRPRAGRWLVVLACAGVWLGSCVGMARWVEQHGLREPAALDAAQRAQLGARAAAGEPIAIVVLGGGLGGLAPEYGETDLSGASLARLRYAAWLARQTGLPVAASGGLGWGAAGMAAPPEGARMAEIARSELATPLRWTETTSRDTHENAVDTVALLRLAGIREIVLVTQGWHMPRALREFDAAVAGATPPVHVTPAPCGQAWPTASPWLDWMPSGEGAVRLREVMHEVIAGLADRR
jgi:uncharacterized SAM-binding protein YcdF (DUF218 family)